MQLRLVHKSVGVLLIIAILIFSTIVDAAPSPTLFVYNDTSKQCGTFRDGDENVSYKLPIDWKTYDYNKTNLKTTQQYCDELGYTNIGSVVDFLDLSANNLQIPSENNPTNNFNYSILFIAISILITSSIIILAIITKKSSSNDINSEKQ